MNGIFLCGLTGLSVRPALFEDLTEINRIYDTARRFMREHGNKSQWSGGYPSDQVIKDDIDNKNGFIVSCGEIPCGAFAMFSGIDPTYVNIYDGDWLNNEPYCTIHRIAGDGTEKGVLKTAVCFASLFSDNVRIDTHADNYPMQNALSRLGFSRCGTIFLADGSPRIAYHIKLGTDNILRYNSQSFNNLINEK